MDSPSNTTKFSCELSRANLPINLWEKVVLWLAGPADAVDMDSWTVCCELARVNSVFSRIVRHLPHLGGVGNELSEPRLPGLTRGWASEKIVAFSWPSDAGRPRVYSMQAFVEFKRAKGELQPRFVAWVLFYDDDGAVAYSQPMDCKYPRSETSAPTRLPASVHFGVGEGALALGATDAAAFTSRFSIADAGPDRGAPHNALYLHLGDITDNLDQTRKGTLDSYHCQAGGVSRDLKGKFRFSLDPVILELLGVPTPARESIMQAVRVRNWF